MGYRPNFLSRSLVCQVCSLLIVTLLVSGKATAQDDSVLPTRVPEVGLAVLDCEPPAPAPQDTCIVRVPSDHTLGSLASRDLGDEKADFSIVRNQDELPDGVILSSTLVLVDLSKGPNNGRLRSWDRERDAIRSVIAGLPRSGEVAVYGFGANLTSLSNFSDDWRRALGALDDLKLSENNTILTSNIADAIGLLKGREKALFKNLIIVSDGDEEGVGTFDEINTVAAQANVTLSALGMFWRGEGQGATTRGMDVLNRVTRPQNGLMQPVFLRNQADVAGQVDAFSKQFSSSIGRSGLIVPNGTPAAARITVEMNVPIIGQAGETRTETYRVKFTPVQVEIEEPPVVIVEPQTSMIFGFPALYVYAAAGIAVLLLLLLLFLLLRRRGSDDEELADTDSALAFSDGFEDGLDDQLARTGLADANTVHEVAVAAKAPKLPVSAYLVRVDTGERLPIRGDRVAVGRSSSNSVSLPDHGVSRVHAELHRNRDGGFSLTDLDSLNGTFLNEKKVKGTIQIRIGDTLGFGKVRTKLTLP